ncbi:hypothetical protein [Kitasatospora arboriphila]|uniref:AbiV family abortive infection protein n=1 Tax=Kitasatospora arboriphila TaxID=258052 RepID=A0ABP4EG10_9ACTN
MTPASPTTVDPDQITTALIGFHRAVLRLQADAAASPQDDDGLTVLASATECLFWACAIEEAARDDQTYATGADSYGRSLLTGARWARNQATHRLAFVVTKPDDDSQPEAVWRPATELPTPDWESPKQRAAYDTHLAGQPVLRTFQHIASFFAHEQNRHGSFLNTAAKGLADLRNLDK